MRVVEVSASSLRDPECGVVTALWNARVEAEQARMFRRTLCRRVLIGAVLLAAVAASTRIVSSAALGVMLIVLAIPAGFAAFFELRARARLRKLIEAAPNALTVHPEPPGSQPPLPRAGGA